MESLSKLKLQFTPIDSKDAVNKEYVDNKFLNAKIYKYCGTLSSYSYLPTENLEIGMVYNIENADSEHNIKRGDNVAWNGQNWDNLNGVIDFSNFYTKDEIDDLLSSLGNGSGSTYYGSIELSESVINIKSSEISKNKINTHTILMLKSSEFSNDETNIDTVKINSDNTEISIVDKFFNPLKISDVITGGIILLGFNGENFVLLTKEYLINSYQSSSTTNAPTANALKNAYDSLYSIIGDIPEVLDEINRKVI